MRSIVPSIRALRLATAALLALVAVSGCTEESIVYRDRAPFNPPLDVAGFLGYFNASTKQTTCGNCHATFQAKWKTTKHASAYANLSASVGKKPECFGCHTVTGNGNRLVGTPVGHDAVKDSVYFDVQCESCHGAGLQHVEGVGQGSIVRPLAHLGMTGTGNCGDCHSGNHQPFAEEWRASGHANVNASRAGNAECKSCHDGRGALASWGVESNYAERDSATSYQPTTCAVCHAPHGSANPAQLRFPVTAVDPANNLCMKCHLRRTEPQLTSSSPHAPQGAMLLGFAGYRPPGFAYDTARIFGSHATTANPKLCAGCHAGKFTVTDAATGAFSFQATGHLMRPVPCLDSLGKPTATKTCGYTSTARSWQTCAASGCHANAAAASTAFATVRSRMKFLADQLWNNIDNDATLDAAPTDGGLLATLKQTRPAEWSTTDLVITPAEGAEFNARLCGEYNSSNSDNSKGVHNPFLCEALLISSINYVRSYYALPPLTAAVQAEISGPIGGQYSASMHVSRTPPGR